MATVAACAQAMAVLAERLSGADERTRGAVVARSLSCTIKDLDVVFLGDLRDGGLRDIRQADELRRHEDARDAQVRLTVGSDDLLALTDGSLSMAHAWATGRLKIDASVRDLLRLRSFF